MKRWKVWAAFRRINFGEDGGSGKGSGEILEYVVQGLHARQNLQVFHVNQPDSHPMAASHPVSSLGPCGVAKTSYWRMVV